MQGLLYATKACCPAWSRGRGRVVNIGSVAGNCTLPGDSVYCGTAFTNHLSLAMRADLNGTGVRVTSIEPGNTETGFSVVRFKGDAEKAEKVYAGETERVAMTAATRRGHTLCDARDRPPRQRERIELMPEQQGWAVPFDRS